MLAVIILRLIFAKTSKTVFFILWALVGIRLILPFSLESSLSMIPSAEPLPEEMLFVGTPMIDSGIPVVNEIVNPIVFETLAPDAGVSVVPQVSHVLESMTGEAVTPMFVMAIIGLSIWVAGVIALLLYAGISYFRVYRLTREGVSAGDNAWLCDHIPTPFILGVFRPRIFLPSDIQQSDMVYVIAHERMHLKRRDHWWKPLGFLVLSIHWFNPLVWVAYHLLCKDIEMACDEKVIRVMGTDIKRPYAEALINCSVPRRIISVCPLAFGEVSVKRRIKGVLNYKKPAFWLVILAVVSSVLMTAFFFTEPITDGSNAEESITPPSADTVVTTAPTSMGTTTTTTVTRPTEYTSNQNNTTTTVTPSTVQNNGTATVVTRPATDLQPVYDIPIGETVLDNGVYEVQGSRGLLYTQTKNGLKVSGIGNCKDTHLRIPSEYGGYPVVGIADGAFALTRIESVELPEGLSFIGGEAFRSTTIQTVRLPNSLMSLGNQAFAECKQLREAIISPHITTLGAFVFENCSSLSNVTFMPGATTVGESMFEGCSKLSTVSLAGTVKTVQKRAFHGCFSLSWNSLPPSIEVIGRYAFAGCRISRIVVTESFAGMKGAFAGVRCGELEFEEGITYINDELCLEMEECTYVILPEGVLGIGRLAFSAMPDLVHVALPSTLTSIGNHAFLSCNSVLSIDIPDSVTYIGENALTYGCYPIERVFG